MTRDNRDNATLHIGLASYSIQGQRFLFIEADLASRLARRGVVPPFPKETQP